MAAEVQDILVHDYYGLRIPRTPERVLRCQNCNLKLTFEVFPENEFWNLNVDLQHDVVFLDPRMLVTGDVGNYNMRRVTLQNNPRAAEELVSVNTIHVPIDNTNGNTDREVDIIMTEDESDRIRHDSGNDAETILVDDSEEASDRIRHLVIVFNVSSDESDDDTMSMISISSGSDDESVSSYMDSDDSLSDLF